MGNGGKTPAISDGSGTGEAFTAVVGGNAWIDFGTTEGQDKMNPKFFGDTHIAIDLVGAAYEGEKTEKTQHEFGDDRGTGILR